jgi:hypothetical protein
MAVMNNSRRNVRTGAIATPVGVLFINDILTHRGTAYSPKNLAIMLPINHPKGGARHPWKRSIRYTKPRYRRVNRAKRRKNHRWANPAHWT